MRSTKRQYARHLVWTRVKRPTTHWDWYYKAAKLNVGFSVWHRVWVWFISRGSENENHFATGPVARYVADQIGEK